MNWQNVLTSLPGVIIGLTVHEFCHALAAHKLGDPTAREQGRLSFNPLKHIDLIGFLFLVFAGFGWARPVQFNPENLRHPRRDKAVIAAAGPLSNFLLALVFIFMIKGFLALSRFAYSPGGTNFLRFFLSSPVLSPGFIIIVLQAAAVNLGLFVFNLIPIPPLDGSHIVFSGLNLGAETERRIMKIGAPLLFIILIIENRTDLDILPIGKFVFAVIGVFIPELGLGRGG
jgi:Zn-dependent protease